MVQIPPRRWHWLRAIILASPIKKLRPQPTERTPTAWHTNDEYKNAEASEEASASSVVANVSVHRVLPIPTSSLISDTNPTFITVFMGSVSSWHETAGRCDASIGSPLALGLALAAQFLLTHTQKRPVPSLAGSGSAPAPCQREAPARCS